MIDLTDTLAINRVIALLAHIIDAREWDRLSEVFTDDVVSDASAVGFGRIDGLSDVIAGWSGRDTHALAHYSTNVVLTGVDADTVDALSKGLSLYATDDLHTVTHRDRIVRTQAGWRIARRVTVRQGADLKRLPLQGQ
jgi:hypothetical protein